LIFKKLNNPVPDRRPLQPSAGTEWDTPRLACTLRI